MAFKVEIIEHTAVYVKVGLKQQVIGNVQLFVFYLQVRCMGVFGHVTPVVCLIVSLPDSNVFQKCLLVLNGLQQVSAAPLQEVANNFEAKLSCLFL